MTLETCPVCEGRREWQGYNPNFTEQDHIRREPCTNCGGTGKIETTTPEQEPAKRRGHIQPPASPILCPKCDERTLVKAIGRTWACPCGYTEER
jgi:RecJ-like exonuclease